jgi:RNA polymerase sigma-70 factor (ECF subfamily)
MPIVLLATGFGLDQNPDRLDTFLAHRGALVSYATRIVGERADAEDVVQDAYLRFEAAEPERRLDEPRAYLFRIVRNLALDLRRRIGRDHLRCAADAGAALAGLATDDPSPETEAEARSDLRRLSAAMAELPARTREALELHRLQGLTIREIAARLGISTGLAHALVTDGLEHCRQRLRGRDQ